MAPFTSTGTEPLARDKMGKNMEPYIIGSASGDEGVSRHDGGEFLFVLEGKHELTYNGMKYIMEQGDSVYSDAGFPHTGRSLGGKRAKLLAVVYNYRRV